MLTLLHEYEHTAGISDETEAQCRAFDLLRPVLVGLYGFSPKEARARYRDAWAYSMSQPPAYRGTNC